MKYIWDEETDAVRVFFPQNAKDQADLERIRERISESEKLTIVEVDMRRES